MCADTRVNHAYGLFAAFSVVGFDVIFISVSYVMIWRTVLWLSSGEARLKAFGTRASQVILAFMPCSPYFSHPLLWISSAPNGTCHVSYSLSPGASHAQPHHLWS